MNNNIDIEYFFKTKISKKLPLFFNTRLARSFNLRILSFKAWRNDFFTPKEAVLNFFPGRFKPANLNEKLYEYIKIIADQIFQGNNLYREDLVKLFGVPFFPAEEKTTVDSWLNFFILYFQIVVKDQYHLKNFLKQDSIVIDAGANIGIFSAAAANACTLGAIYAFEPGSIAFKALENNLSSYQNIKLMHCGLGAAQADVDFSISNSTTANFILENNVKIKGTNSERIKIDTIDNFVKANNLNRVDFIKIDVEGYEDRVIEGARETIKKFSPVIAMSAYHKKDDKYFLSQLVLSTNHFYKYKLYKDTEDVLVFWK